MRCRDAAEGEGDGIEAAVPQEAALDLRGNRQLDAFDTPACLRAAYAQWQAYFDENYDLGDVVDYQ